MGQYCSRCYRTIKHSDKIILYIDYKRTHACKKCFIAKKKELHEFKEIHEFKELHELEELHEFKKLRNNPLTESEQHALRELCKNRMK
jgi:hypothetical protein